MSASSRLADAGSIASSMTGSIPSLENSANAPNSGDPGAATAEVARQMLAQNHLLAPTTVAGTADYYTTGDVSQFNELASQWLNIAPIKVAHLPVSTLEMTATEV